MFFAMATPHKDCAVLPYVYFVLSFQSRQLANVVLYRVRAEHDLNRSDAPLPVRARNEALRDNALKYI